MSQIQFFDQDDQDKTSHRKLIKLILWCKAIVLLEYLDIQGWLIATFLNSDLFLKSMWEASLFV